MNEQNECLIMDPRVEGLEEPTAIQLTVQNALKNIFERSETYQQTATLDEAMRQTVYREVFHPDYETNPITELVERNRQILIWAYQHGIQIASELVTYKGYSSVETAKLLQLLNEDQLQLLQGAMIFSLGRGRIKDVDSDQTVAFGGIIYSQSLIDEGKDGILLGLVSRLTAVPSGFSEPGVLPKLLGKNVRGAIHVLPYGVPEKIPGKEKETLLMLYDDMIRLIEAFRKSGEVNFPRFILNSTNRTMGQAAERYLGAQVQNFSEADSFIDALSDNLSMKEPADTTDIVKVFIPQETLEQALPKLIGSRERLFLAMKGSSGINFEELLKGVRIEAICMIADRMSFADGYQEKHQQSETI